MRPRSRRALNPWARTPTDQTMVRALLTRLLREEDGFTLTEQLVVAGGMAVVLSAILGLSEVAIKQAPEDRERVHAVRDAQISLDKMNRELRSAYAITVQDFKATASVYRNGGTLTVTYDCSGAPVGGVRKCVRSQSGSGAPTSATVIERVANPTARPVFTPTTRPDKDGVHWTTYVRTRVEVQGRGELKAGSTARTVLDDGFYVRNVDARH